MIHLCFKFIILLSCCCLHCGCGYTDYTNGAHFEDSRSIVDTPRESIVNNTDDTYNSSVESLSELGLNISDNQLSQAEYSSADLSIRKKVKPNSNLFITTESQINQITGRDIVDEVMSKLPILTTTSIPYYIHRTRIPQTTDDAQDEFSTVNYKGVHWPSSLSQRTPKQAVEYDNTKPLIIDNHYSTIAGEIVPLAINYYAAQQRQMESDDSNDSKQKDKDNNNMITKLDPPVAMPQQQLWQQDQPEEQSQLQTNSGEYYEFKDAIKQSSPKYAITRSNRSNGMTIESRTQLSIPSIMQTQEQPQQQSREEFANLRVSMLGDAWSTLTVPTTTTTTLTSPDANIFTTTLSNLAKYSGKILYDMAASEPPLIAVTTTVVTNQRLPIAADKKGKEIPISVGASTQATAKTTTSRSSNRRRLLPHEQLRHYIEDAYIRMPLAVIVDPSSSSLEKSKLLWNDALSINTNIQIVLITLSGSGVPAAFNFNNTHQFLTGLNSIKERKGGDALVGILHASDLVPYDSAVFISTAVLPPHTELVQNAAITLLKKRIRLYLMWFGERALSENETQESLGGILGEIALRSGGEILHVISNENYEEIERSTLTIVAEALRGPQVIEVPVDTTLSGLHVKIDKLTRKAMLETPSGDINLKSLVKFKTFATADNEDNARLNAYVPLLKLHKATIFKLKIIPEDMDTEYSVFIRAEREADELDQTMPPKNGRLQAINSLTVGLNGFKIPANPKYNPKNEAESLSTKKIRGPKKIFDNSSLLQLQRSLFQHSNTKIVMGSNSKILISPGDLTQLYFEITNTGVEGLHYYLQVADEKRFLINLAPQSLYVASEQSVTVTLTVSAPIKTEVGTTDHITFSAYSASSSTSLSLLLRVISHSEVEDTEPPTISWTIGNRCDFKVDHLHSCSEFLWSLNITAQDKHTGILRLVSIPSNNLFYTNSYTVGSKDPIRATYISTCCSPTVQLIAYDVIGNQKRYHVSVEQSVLNGPVIAAITMGMILAILLSVLLIAGVIWCCRRRKGTMNLPSYRSR
uniref:VWA7 Ig-like domain-containing protein n=1 Tax=Glossina austeni TaxID=7395 RepID=A0A1A9VDA4_GLOAU